MIDKDVLFDTFGDSDYLLKNMRTFKVDMARIKHIVLSHDDWDHIGGLWRLLDGRKDVTVYICPGFKQEIKDKIISSGARVVEVSALTEIKEGVFSSGQIQAFRGLEKIFEQVLIIKFLKRLTVVTGCAHPGIVNIVDIVQKSFSREKVYSILGGLHLKDSSMTEIDEVVLALRARGVSKIAPTHCTGENATKAFEREYGIDFLKVVPGFVIEV